MNLRSESENLELEQVIVPAEHEDAGGWNAAGEPEHADSEAGDIGDASEEAVPQLGHTVPRVENADADAATAVSAPLEADTRLEHADLSLEHVDADGDHSDAAVEHTMTHAEQPATLADQAKAMDGKRDVGAMQAAAGRRSRRLASVMQRLASASTKLSNASAGLSTRS